MGAVMSTRSCLIDKIDIELIDIVFSSLDVVSLFCCKFVCKKWHRTVYARLTNANHTFNDIINIASGYNLVQWLLDFDYPLSSSIHIKFLTTYQDIPMLKKIASITRRKGYLSAYFGTALYSQFPYWVLQHLLPIASNKFITAMLAVGYHVDMYEQTIWTALIRGDTSIMDTLQNSTNIFSNEFVCTYTGTELRDPVTYVEDEMRNVCTSLIHINTHYNINNELRRNIQILINKCHHELSLYEHISKCEDIKSNYQKNRYFDYFRSRCSYKAIV